MWVLWIGRWGGGREGGSGELRGVWGLGTAATGAPAPVLLYSIRVKHGVLRPRTPSLAAARVLRDWRRAGARNDDGGGGGRKRASKAQPDAAPGASGGTSRGRFSVERGACAAELAGSSMRARCACVPRRPMRASR